MGQLVMVRHGQASFHEEDYDKLSVLGEEQCHHLGAYWARHKAVFDRVYSGPLARQRRSAEIAGAALTEAGVHWPDVEIVEALAEMPVERLAKRFMPQLCADDEEALAFMKVFVETENTREKEKAFQKAFEKLMLRWASEEYHDPEIETFAHFQARVTDALQAIMASATRGQRIAVFTSGGPTAAAVHMALNTHIATTLEMVWQLRNASTTEFVFTKGRFSLGAFNSIQHLSDPALWTYR
jgi:broad specificity phosphatase PhoE